MSSEHTKRLQLMETARRELCFVTEIVSATIEEDCVDLLEPGLKSLHTAFDRYVESLQGALQRFQQNNAPLTPDTEHHVQRCA